MIFLVPHLLLQAFQSSEICSTLSWILAPDTFTHEEPFSVEEVTATPGRLSLHNVPETDLFPPADPPSGSDLHTKVRPLDRPRVCEAGVVEVGEQGIETHQLPVVGPELKAEAVHTHNPDHPLNLRLGKSLTELANVPKNPINKNFTFSDH